MIQKIINQIVGAKYISILRTWVPNMVAWGSVGGVALVHFTDWRLILDYVPYVNGKFKGDDEYRVPYKYLAYKDIKIEKLSEGAKKTILHLDSNHMLEMGRWLDFFDNAMIHEDTMRIIDLAQQ